MRRKPQTAERHEACGGFSYIDALAAASLSCLFAILVQSTLAPQLRLMKNDHSIIRDNSDAELKVVAEKLRLDIRAAQPPVSTSPQNESAACELAGRRPVLHLVDSLGRPITYSVGDAPAPIWRSPVLMRCARPSTGGAAINQVLIDGLAMPQEAWSGCGALFNPGEGEPPTLNIDLANSSQLGFSACRRTDRNAVGVRVILTKVNPSTKTNYQFEELMTSSS